MLTTCCKRENEKNSISILHQMNLVSSTRIASYNKFPGTSVTPKFLQQEEEASTEAVAIYYSSWMMVDF